MNWLEVYFSLSTAYRSQKAFFMLACQGFVTRLVVGSRDRPHEESRCDPAAGQRGSRLTVFLVSITNNTARIMLFFGHLLSTQAFLSLAANS